MKVQFPSPRLTVLALSVLAGNAPAAVIFTTGGAAGTNNFFLSDSAPTASPARWTAGAITLTGGEVLRSVTFRGITSNGAASQSFEIAILAADGPSGTPGSVVLDTTPLATFSKTLSGSNQYIFEADLPLDVDLNAGDYWVSIVDTTPGVDFSFNGTNGSGALTYHSTSGHTSGYSTFSGPQRINVIGDDTRFDPSIPEPSAITLVIGGAGLLVRRRRA